MTIVHVIEPLVRVLGAGPRHGLQAAVLPGAGGAAHEVLSRGLSKPVEAAAVSRALTATTLVVKKNYRNLSRRDQYYNSPVRLVQKLQ